MFHLAAALARRIRRLLQYAPTNRLLTWLHRRDRLRFGMLFMLLGVAYAATAGLIGAWIRDGAPEWLHLVVLLAFWNALKFLAFGPVSVVLLIRARLAERAAAHA